ncbi:c-type cytochrome [Flavobacterium sp. MAH-1]|uniref:C-type cytochrome n=1 Tax=Flavobacterium agri TaxID=2743471 RepID=A0A7Y8Y3U6_9FLAO|nr:cytochrome c peroxidase [Flavobacterium agri]NUY81806.1 c-type cytochrome [Flavobacterium agri]NYA71830.1 c-type cytochrome [Flavobacterium agri]
MPTPNLKKIAIPLTAIFLALIFSPASKRTEEKSSFLDKNLNQLSLQIVKLEKTASDFHTGKTSVDSLQSAVRQTRLQFKKVEFFLAFQYPEFTTEHFNGAPLLHIEKEGTQPSVIEPEGLQVLDELAFSENPSDEKATIDALSKKLFTNYKALFLGYQNNKTSQKPGTDALRLELVRIFTLGVTGFDTPGSLNALDEAKSALEGMKAYWVENYDSEKNRRIYNLFEDAIGFVSSEKSFEKFDRLTFLREYIEPLYAELAKSQESTSEILQRTSAWNNKSSTIFSDAFLNPYYFTELQADDDTPELRDLGKKLFYDTRLSNANMSCASCHAPEKAFADGYPKSQSSLPGKTVLRNAPTLLNAVYADRYFYDLRAFSLEQQAEHVIFNPEEFNTAYSSILEKLKSDPKYASDFKKVFGKKNITREAFSKALASYVLSLRSFNSEFDKYVRKESDKIPEDVKNGFNLFTGKANCATCHFAPTFSGLVPPLYSENESEILGVFTTPDAKQLQLDPDEGRLGNQIHSEKAWIYAKSFKTTTIRNAAKTAPYFHNGAYKTLEEVIDFYDQGGGEGRGISTPNQTLPPDKLNLTDKEKKDLIAFIKSLDDSGNF